MSLLICTLFNSLQSGGWFAGTYLSIRDATAMARTCKAAYRCIHQSPTYVPCKMRAILQCPVERAEVMNTVSSKDSHLFQRRQEWRAVQLPPELRQGLLHDTCMDTQLYIYLNTAKEHLQRADSKLLQWLLEAPTLQHLVMYSADDIVLSDVFYYLAMSNRPLAECGPYARAILRMLAHTVELGEFWQNYLKHPCYVGYYKYVWFGNGCNMYAGRCQMEDFWILVQKMIAMPWDTPIYNEWDNETRFTAPSLFTRNSYLFTVKQQFYRNYKMHWELAKSLQWCCSSAQSIAFPPPKTRLPAGDAVEIVSVYGETGTLEILRPDRHASTGLCLRVWRMGHMHPDLLGVLTDGDDATRQLWITRDWTLWCDGVLGALINISDHPQTPKSRKSPTSPAQTDDFKRVKRRRRRRAQLK